MRPRWSHVLVMCTAVTALLAEPAAALTKCTMTFSLSGWSAFYQTAKGSGTVTCDNGQTSAVTITSKGGGLTFGKRKIVNGRGTFSPVENISELFGNYAKAEAHAGMGGTSSAQALTKGTVSLALSGTGQGVDVGFEFGRFTISQGGAPAK